MKFYWYDHDSRSAEATVPILEGLSTLVRYFSAEQVNSPEGLVGPEPLTAFVHASDDQAGAGQRNWENLAREHLWIVVVSSETIGSIGVPNFVHRLRRPCKDVASYITEEIAEAFKESCTIANPNFELLYPRSTGNLVALYLLELARKERGNCKIGAEIYSSVREAAEKEYSEIVSVPGNAGSRSLPTDRLISSASCGAYSRPRRQHDIRFCSSDHPRIHPARPHQALLAGKRGT